VPGEHLLRCLEVFARDRSDEEGQPRHREEATPDKAPPAHGWFQTYQPLPRCVTFELSREGSPLFVGYELHYR
jgi:hypothetical protein